MNDQSQSADDYPSTGYAWYVVFVLFLAYVVSFVDRQILSLLIEPIKADLQLSDTVIGLLAGFAFAIFYTVMGIPLGRLADRSNRKGIIIVGIAFWSLMTSLCGFARNTLMLFLARIGVGVGEAALAPSAYSMIPDYFPRDKRARPTSIYSLGVFFGAGMAFMFGGVVAGFAAELISDSTGLLAGFRPWQLTFILTGLLGIPVVALMFTVREPVRKERLRADSENLPVREVLAYLRLHWLMYGGIIVGTATITIASYGLFTWAPPMLARLYGYTPGDVGMTMGPMLLILGTLGLVVGGILADKRFRDGHTAAHPDITVGITVLTVIPSGLLYFADSEVMTLICLATIILLLAVHVGLTPAALTLITPNELRGQVIAIYVFVLNLIGLGFGPTAVALITDRIFEDNLAVGKSLAITQCLAVLIGVSLILFGRRAYINRQNELAA